MSQHEPEASPAQQEAVRRLLAEARHGESVPPDVVARLDAALAQLAAEGPRAVDPPPPGRGVVVDLAARRRRRVTNLLVAAAAVVVLGVGVSQVSGVTQDDSESSADAPADAVSDAAEDLREGAEEAAPQGAAEGSDSGGGTGGGTGETAPFGSEAPDQPGLESFEVPPVVLSIPRGSFAATAERLRTAASVLSTDGRSLGGADLTSDPAFVCPLTAWGAGRLVAVSYVDQPAGLIYRPPTGETQTVELLQCGSGEVLRSAVLTFP